MQFLNFSGDIFSCHSIDNPDTESEMSMLRQYGPDVPDHILRKLVLSFGELREQADQGLINYPYSTREVVNMVRHLQVSNIWLFRLILVQFVESYTVLLKVIFRL